MTSYPPHQVSTSAQDQIAASYEFARLAVQYHPTGRFAALSGCIPVAGNLLHHAVEMYLKCALVRSLTLSELKRLGHSLPSLWAVFGRIHPEIVDVDLTASILNLDKLEQLRYPDVAAQTGYQMSFVVQRQHFNPLPSGAQPPYHLVLEDVDEIASLAAMRSGLQPSAFSESLSTQTLHYLLVHNSHLAGVA